MTPDPLSMLLGYAAYHGLRRFKRPLRRTAVCATSQLFGLASMGREAACRMKEEVEDIIAEAHYETMKEAHHAPDTVHGGEEGTVRPGSGEEGDGGQQPL